MAVCQTSCFQPVILYSTAGVPVNPDAKGNFPVSVRCTERTGILQDLLPLQGNENRVLNLLAAEMDQIPSFDVTLFLDETGGVDGADSNVDFIIEASIDGLTFFEIFSVRLFTTAAIPTAVFAERFMATALFYRFRLRNNTAASYGTTHIAIIGNPNT